MRADLHLHTAWSDGTLSPDRVLARAVSAGVTLMAVTDHDTLRGSDALRPLAAEAGVDLLPGIELSLADTDGLHLLLYGRTPARALRLRLEELARQREERARRMLERLAALGMPLDWEAVRGHSRGTVGRPHIVQALLAAGHVRSAQEAYDRWLGNGKPAYVPGERPSMAEALALAKRCGWVPVLAHPRQLGHSDRTLRALVEAWQARGLRGLEVYHPSAVSKGFGPLDRMARELGLLVTGGSDFHAPGDRHREIGAMCAHWERAEEDAAALLAGADAGREETEETEETEA